MIDEGVGERDRSRAFRTLGRVTNRRIPTTVRLLAALALGGALLAGCSSEGAETSCGLDQCTVTFDRGVNGSASILGVEAKFISADDSTVTLEVAGEQVSLTTGQSAVDVGGLAVSVDSVTDTHVAVRIARNGG